MLASSTNHSANQMVACERQQVRIRRHETPPHGQTDHCDNRRSGLTLLEIVLALAVFFCGITALSQLAWNGTRAAVQARLKTQAAIRCETKLNEVLVGADVMQNVSGVPFPDNPSWTWSEIVTPSAHSGLVQIDLTVSHQGSSRLANVSVTLRRWTRLPELFAQAANQQKQETEGKATSP